MAVSRLLGALRRVFVRPAPAYYDGLIEEAVRGLDAVKASSQRIAAVHDALTQLSPADLARLKSAEELRKLATHAFHGTGTEKNVYLATALWTFAGMRGDVESLYSLAQCIRDGVGYPGEVYGGPNAAAAMALLEEVLEQTEHGWSMFALATMLLQEYGVVGEGEEALRTLQRQAAKSEDAARRDAALRRALSLYRRAAELGVGPACLNVSNFYFTGVGGVEKDEKRGLYWLHRAAKLGDPVALTQLGYRLSKGVGLSADEKKAFRLYERAAVSGRPQALHNMGAAYMGGMGVEKDEKRAAEYFRQAALAGNLASKWNLAHMLEQGRGVAQDFDEAIRLLKEIAAEGYAEDVEEALEQLERRRAGSHTAISSDKVEHLLRGGARLEARGDAADDQWNTKRDARDKGAEQARAAPAAQEPLSDEKIARVEATAKLDISIDPSGMKDRSKLEDVLARLQQLGTSRSDKVLAFFEAEAAIHGFRVVVNSKPAPAASPPPPPPPPSSPTGRRRRRLDDDDDDDDVVDDHNDGTVGSKEDGQDGRARGGGGERSGRA